MNKTTIEKFVINVFAEITLRPNSSINREMHLEADLGLDSISIAGSISKFEDIIATHPEVNQLTQSLLGSTTVGEFIDLIIEGAQVEVEK